MSFSSQGCPDECVIDQRPKLILTPYINTQGLCCQDVSSKIHPKSLLFLASGIRPRECMSFWIFVTPPIKVCNKMALKWFAHNQYMIVLCDGEPFLGLKMETLVHECNKFVALFVPDREKLACWVLCFFAFIRYHGVMARSDVWIPNNNTYNTTQCKPLPHTI